MSSWQHQSEASWPRRTKDHQVLFVVRYRDQPDAYMRVPPALANFGVSPPVLRAALERQALGEIPPGEIVAVVRARWSARMRNSPSYIAHQPRPRSGDRQALFLVRYADATSTMMRVSPGIAVFGPSRLSAVAAERQDSEHRPGALRRGPLAGTVHGRSRHPPHRADQVQNVVLVPCRDQLPKQAILLACISPHSLWTQDMPKKPWLQLRAGYAAARFSAALFSTPLW
jgi:hypothetical protein